MRLFLLILFILSLLGGCTTHTPERVYEEVIEITEINPNRLTFLTKQNLFHLAKVYDLKPFLYTKKIYVQSYIVPHSHPTLTLNTRNAEKPHKLLATWLHEEFHWWAELHKMETASAIKEFSKIFPKFPKATYLHLIICFVEYQAMIHYMGEKEAQEIIQSHITEDKIYPWIYTQVLEKNDVIGKIIRKNKLLPPPLT